MNSIKARFAGRLATLYSKVVNDLTELDLDWSEAESQAIVVKYINARMDGYADGYLSQVQLTKAELTALDECIEFHKETIIKLFKD